MNITLLIFLIKLKNFSIKSTIIGNHIDENADRTVILYITPWKPAWGGFTHFMKSEKEHAVIVPLFGRMINFRSDISHKAYSFCNQNCPMRVTAAFKLKL